MRTGHPLKHFMGESKYYIFPTVCGDDSHIEDYGESYDDLPSLVELLGTFIKRESGDEEYADRMVLILSDKLNITSSLKEEYRNKVFVRRRVPLSISIKCAVRWHITIPAKMIYEKLWLKYQMSFLHRIVLKFWVPSEEKKLKQYNHFCSIYFLDPDNPKGGIDDPSERFK